MDERVPLEFAAFARFIVRPGSCSLCAHGAADVSVYGAVTVGPHGFGPRILHLCPDCRNEIGSWQ